MLKGISPIISPELLKVLCEMGHGDELVIADGNFPSHSVGKNAVVIRADGHGVPELLDAILSLIPLDTHVEKPVALMEVSAGSADAAVIDLLMAGAMLGENSSYKNLTYTLNLNELQGLPSEEYAVGFRTGSTLTEAFNTFWAEQVESGAAMEVATRYGLQESIIQ